MSSELERFFRDFNRRNAVPDRSNYRLNDVDQFAAEVPRLFRYLKQRRRPGQNGNTLVDRMRVEMVERYRPVRNVQRGQLSNFEADVARLAPQIPSFSSFQVEGWGKVHAAIRQSESIVIVAPTGTGKTEVFVLPVVHDIADALTRGEQRHFVFLYPRVALLKDQLVRILRAVHHAQQTLFGGESRLTVGFQFMGIFSEREGTLGNRDVFDEQRNFLVIDGCPVCGDQGYLRYSVEKGRPHLGCTNSQCDARFRVSLSKQDHKRMKPHIMVTTAQALDRFYLDSQYADYICTLSGVVFDEVHMYHSIYGTHIYNIFRRIDSLRNGSPIVRIASSATVINPATFISKLFHGRPGEPVTVHASDDSVDPVEPSGREFVYFIQSPERAERNVTTSTMIQTVMAMGHGVLTGTPDQNERMILFSDSLDQVRRFRLQIGDAERRGRLWQFRTNVPLINFNGQDCPRTRPDQCHIFQRGECWRGALGGNNCHDHLPALREQPLELVEVTSGQRGNFSEGDVLIATSTLEVGVDDENIKATLHYSAPRTVYSFIQRRGRAGRRPGDDAYTVMVLGNSPSEQFYFYRRHRLIHGTFELPLNPDNPVVREIHDDLEAERNRVARLVRLERGSPKRGIRRWVLEKLRECHFLHQTYGNTLNRWDTGNLHQRLGEWIDGELEPLTSYLNLRWQLRRIRQEVPPVGNLQQLVNSALDIIERYFRGEVTQNDVANSLRNLEHVLSNIQYASSSDPDLVDMCIAFRREIGELWSVLTRHNVDVRFQHAEQLYDFFKALGKLRDEKAGRNRLWWRINYAPDAIKIVLQALYYLHLGDVVDTEGDDCPSKTENLVPTSYFQSTRRIVVEKRPLADDSEERKREESATFLSNYLIPYRTFYRYYGGYYLSTLDLQTIDVTSGEGDIPTVRVHLEAEGLHRHGRYEPQKVYVRPIESDERADQVVKLCPECYAIYKVSRRQPCHAPLRTVKLNAEPELARGYDLPGSLIMVSRTLGLAEEVVGTTTIFGSYVRHRRANWTGQEQGYVLTQQVGDFRAVYDEPVHYSLRTKGVKWDLHAVVGDLISNAELKHQVESIYVKGQSKTLSARLILHTASHMLLRAVAAIGGVNEQSLEYGFSEERSEAVVWEGTEGGAGVSEVFAARLRAEPIDVYRELLGSVLCPIYFSEADTTTPIDDLLTRLSQTWALQEDDSFLLEVTREIAAEQTARAERQGEEDALLCLGRDGCPVCIYTNGCSTRRDQPISVSRLVAEAIMRQFIRRVSRSEAEEIARRDVENGQGVPELLTIEGEQDEFYALTL